ncbi:hypothetical protein PAHAL_8G222200 [Panicum hallii]|uniref:Myb/SANT-like domain-containing protein n=1 Tax=Panicum hallii TaxID=206008 RepID=A0A2T8I9W2_9POAL|nr:hypothetical protein PAHAL_8G222200 [Panicum hallii]
MVRKGSPRFNMSSSPKLHRYMPTTSASKKKPSPKCNGAKKSGGSPRVKQRADWNPALERSLVDILHEYKDSGYRGDNGWNSEGWNKMVKEFHLRNKYVSYTKAQIQEKEGQLKRDYKMLKAAKQQSGSSWNEKRNMVEGPPAMWTNLMVVIVHTFPKIKKFNNNKTTFPLFDALGELYDGGDGTEKNEEGLQEMADTLSRDEKNDAPAIERSGQQRPAASRNKQEKELTRPRKNENIAKSYAIFIKSKENREVFICACEVDQESALIWLRSEMA